MSQPIGSLYRNARGRYHLAAPDWIQSGQATCGASVRLPAYIYDLGWTKPGKTTLPEWIQANVCAHCLPKIMERMGG